MAEGGQNASTNGATNEQINYALLEQHRQMAEERRQNLSNNDTTNNGNGSLLTVNTGTSGLSRNSAAIAVGINPVNSSGSPLVLLQPLVHFSEVELLEKVGHGSYGVVYKAIWNNKFVAVKEFGASAEQKAIEIEVKQLSRVQHPNIIALLGISVNQQSKYLIMEYAEGGSLHQFLHGKVKPYYSKAHAMSWARQCAEGVAYLHAMQPKPLIHRDLKPLNLLLTNKGRHLKICDFGTVADKSTWMTNNKGSAAWMAPEVFEGSKYTEKCDVFSWAIVLWEVLSRQQPFKEIDNTYSIMWKIHKGVRPPLIKDCPEEIKNLMTSCWETTPDLRPAMQHVVKIMNELAHSFPGNDEPLEYEFVNQQIILRNSEATDEYDNFELSFSNFTSGNSTATTQTTPTNSTTDMSSTASTSSTPTNSVEALKPKTNISMWGAIPEESEASSAASPESTAGNPFCLTPSAEASRRYSTIQNGMSQMANVALAPLNLDVDPNAWELGNANDNVFAAFNNCAKSDGKQLLSVTEEKPILPPGILNNTNSDSEDDNDGTDDQSLHEILDPELQPEPPIPDNAQSQEIYEDHRKLAKEYLRVDTKLYYAQDLKEKLLAQMDPAERQEKQELLKKMSEKEELLDLYNNLKQQLEKIRASQQQQQQQQQQQSPVNAPSLMHSPAQHQRLMNQQNSISSSSIQNEIVADDGWVVVAPPQENT